MTSVFNQTFFSNAHRKNREEPIDRCFVKNDFCELFVEMPDPGVSTIDIEKNYRKITK